MQNTFKAQLLTGKQKKNPDKTWTGVLVEVTVEGTVYSGIVFPKRQSSINDNKAIEF
jgi:hypothetical protein